MRAFVEGYTKKGIVNTRKLHYFFVFSVVLFNCVFCNVCNSWVLGRRVILTQANTNERYARLCTYTSIFVSFCVGWVYFAYGSKIKCLMVLLWMMNKDRWPILLSLISFASIFHSEISEHSIWIHGGWRERERERFWFNPWVTSLGQRFCWWVLDFLIWVKIYRDELGTLCRELT